MRIFRRGVVAAVLLAGCSFAVPVMAQDQTSRLDLLEQQVKQLTGQVEVLNHELELMKAAQKQGAADPVAVPALRSSATAAVLPPEAGETISDPTPVAARAATRVVVGADGAEMAVPAPDAPEAATASPPQVLGTLGTSAARPGDGGFQGQVLVAPGSEEAASVQGGMTTPEAAVEQVALASPADTPESLYERSNERLLRRQFDGAAQGFRDFLTKYPDHALAGSAQFWLGETYYQQGDYAQAAQNFLNGYRSYGKSRRAADSLVKLGMSLNRLGQKGQACAAFGSVAGDYPTAVEAKQRAAAEAKRAGC